MKPSVHRITSLVSFILSLILIQQVRTITVFSPPSESLHTLSGQIVNKYGFPIPGITVNAVDISMRSGYYPRHDDYSFQNDTWEADWQNFVDTFGENNTGSKNNPLIDAYYYYQNTYLKEVDANCGGMTASSALIKTKRIVPSNFLEDNNAPYTYKLGNTEKVRDLIIKYQFYEYGKQITELRGYNLNHPSISTALDNIKSSIDNNFATPQKIVLSGPINNNPQCGVHALLPYSYWIQDGVTYVAVYDPNLEGGLAQVIVFNSDLSWSYDHRKRLGREVWSSKKTCGQYNELSYLYTLPISLFEEMPEPPWKNNSLSTPAMNSITVRDNSEILIVDNLGRKVGIENQQIILEIPDSFHDIPMSIAEDQPRSHSDRYIIPDLGEFTAFVTYKNPGNTNFYAVLANGQISVDGSSSNSGTTDTIQIASNASEVTVQAGSESSNRSITFVQGEPYPQQLSSIEKLSLSTNQQAHITHIDHDTKLSFSANTDQNNYRVRFELSKSLEDVFLATIPHYTANDIHIVSLDKNNLEQAILEIDHSGDGNIDETIILENEMSYKYFPLIHSDNPEDNFDTHEDDPIYVSNDIQPESTRVVKTDSQGKFVFDNLPAGLYDIVPSSNDYQFAPDHKQISFIDGYSNLLFIGNSVYPDPNSNRLALGWNHTCAITNAGKVKCWGDGMTVRGTYEDALKPVEIEGLSSGVIAIKAGVLYTCALLENGEVKCWGNNEEGELGDGTRKYHDVPQPVINLPSKVIELSAGPGSNCALLDTGSIKCWGANWSGQLGDGTTINRDTPVDVIGLPSKAISVVTGGDASCALTVLGDVYCWGSNYYGELGDGTRIDRKKPVKVKNLPPFTQGIDLGGGFACALTSSRGLKCWGAYERCRTLGNGRYGGSLKPVDVVGLLSDVISFSTGDDQGCAISSINGAKCWGHNYYGLLGDGTTKNRSSPVNVKDINSDYVIIKTSFEHSCAMTNQDRIKCWGSNTSGQLGNGSRDSSLVPVDVDGFE